MDEVIGLHANPAAVDKLRGELRTMALTDATLYVGYPILTTGDGPITVDGILTSVEHGIIVFDLEPSGCGGPQDWDRIEERQRDLEIALKSKLIRHKELTDKTRNLAVPLYIVTYMPAAADSGATPGEIITAFEGRLAEKIGPLTGMNKSLVKPLNAVIQQVTTIKPRKKRLDVERNDSRGGKLKVIEREIANLDRWQKRGAIECPEGPQRIRGLAGSGKTVVLALKAAYLHARHPDWDIAVSFQTRSLYDQFRDLIRRFTFEHIEDEPNWERLRVIHAWGSPTDPGLYARIAKADNLPCRDFGYGKRKYGSDGAFEGVCKEALADLQGRGQEPFLDALLLDEAQDFGPNFFKLAYSSVKPPGRFIWAYDELQSLSGATIPGVEELFGQDENGKPRVSLKNLDAQPQQDLILPICYRNTPWALTVAHALGFGVYREGGLIQMFDDPSLWRDIGYEVFDGALAPGSKVALRRKVDASPAFFSQLLTPEDSVQFLGFRDDLEQADWVADQIHKNLHEDELDPNDILIIFSNPVSVPADAGPLIAKLLARGVDSHIAGVTNSPNEFFKPDSIVVSGIHRAKGNEAPMVYVLGAEYCNGAQRSIRRRNTLFTAITRSKAWVRVCGVGPDMDRLRDEWTQVQKNEFALRFQVPTPEEIRALHRIHRDTTESQEDRVRSGIKGLEEFNEMIERGDITAEDIPAPLRGKISALLAGKQ